MFTLNFDKDCPCLYPKFKGDKLVGYAVWQHERVTHNHLQGYIQFKAPVRRTYVNRLLGGRSHVEEARKGFEACYKYCTKEDSRLAGPWEYGTSVSQGSNKRKLVEAYRASPERLMLEDPAKFRRVEVMIRNNEFYNQSMSGTFDRPWMLELTSFLESSPDRRTIYWVYGPEGNDGKTHYAMFLAHKGWYYTKGGKKDNVVYQYMSDITRNVVIDIPRESKDYIQYDLMEMFKDRTIISNKYEPLTVFSHDTIHVVVMANFLPDFSRISRDRVHVLSC